MRIALSRIRSASMIHVRAKAPDESTLCLYYSSNVSLASFRNSIDFFNRKDDELRLLKEFLEEILLKVSYLAYAAPGDGTSSYEVLLPICFFGFDFTVYHFFNLFYSSNGSAKDLPSSESAFSLISY